MIQKILKQKRTDIIAKWLLNADITKGQTDIVNSIVYPEYNRVVVSCNTRYGKTFSTAVGILIYVYLHENKKILIVAPREAQSKLIRNEIAKLIVDSPQMQRLVDDRASDISRLKKEVSRQKITFKNGCEIVTLSAEGEAERLMGFGADLLIQDETALIDYEVYRSKIFRMLGDNPNSKSVELGNPWHKNGHFYEHWKSDRYHKVHIGWEQALKEGRITQKFVDEARDSLSSTEFRVLYESLFPEDTDDTLIKFEYIKRAIDNNFKEEGTIEWGLDVSREGKDLTVLTKIARGDKIKVLEIHQWAHNTLMETSGKVINLVGKEDLIKVDEVGMGGGVVDKLKEEGMNVEGVKAGASANDSHRFSNLKAEFYFTLAKFFEEDKIDIPNNAQLKKELDSMRFSFRSNGKIKIEDPNKSPDYADSLSLACYVSKSEGYDWVLT